MQRLLPLDDGQQAVSTQGKDFDATAETVLANAIVARSSVGHVVAKVKKQSPPGRMEPGGKVNGNYITSMDYFHQPKCIHLVQGFSEMGGMHYSISTFVSV